MPVAALRRRSVDRVGPEATGLLSQAQALQAWLLIKRDRSETAELAATSALDAAGRAGDVCLAGAAMRCLGEVHMRAGRLAMASDLSIEAAELVRRERLTTADALAVTGPAICPQLWPLLGRATPRAPASCSRPAGHMRNSSARTSPCRPSMCIGVAVLDVPFLALAKAAGYPEPITDLPEVTTLVVAFNMSLAMALWMRVRRHDKRCIRDMCAAMAIEAVVLIAAAGIGLAPRASLVAWQHSLMVPAMAIAMLLRLDMYTRPLRHVAPA